MNSSPMPQDLRIIAVVQARAGSRRLPGKVLRQAAGRPMLGYLLDRLKRAESLDGIVVATSEESEDDAVAALAAAENVGVHRGPLEDVAARLLGAAEAAGADALLRANGDSPLIDPAIVRRAAELFRTERPDLVSNVVRRTFPKGQSVEVIDTAALRTAHDDFESAADREHVTPCFYRHPERYRILGFERAEPVGEIQLSVDTEQDFRRFEALLARMDGPHWSYGLDDILALLPTVDTEQPA